jgi:hypothetical protein
MSHACTRTAVTSGVGRPTSAQQYSSIDRMLASACSVQSTHEQSCGGRQCMAMTRSTGVPDVLVTSPPNGPSAARPGQGTRRRRAHQGGMGGNPATGPPAVVAHTASGRGRAHAISSARISPAPPCISLASARPPSLLPSLPCVPATWTTVTPVYMPGPDQLPGTGSRQGITALD